MTDDSQPSRPDVNRTGEKPKFRRRAQARPDEVLDAAIDLFAERGFERTTVDQIAKRAGISKGALYLYFPSKKAVLEGLVNRAVAPVAEHATDLIAHHDGDPRPIIRQIMGMIQMNLSNPQVLKVPQLIIREAVSVPEIAEIYRDKVLSKVIPAMTALIRQGVTGGHIRHVDPEMTIRSIVGPVLLHVMMAEVFGLRPTDGLAMNRLIENHLTILFAGLEPEGTKP